jgi:hypothetical protein
VRVFGILAILLLIVVALFLYIRGDDILTTDSNDDVSKPLTEAPQPTTAEKGGGTGLETTEPVQNGSSATASRTTEPRTQQAQIIDKKLDQGQVGDKDINAGFRPSFDVVRVDKNCSLLVAGRGVPASIVTVFVGEKAAGEVKTSTRGEWVFTPSKPLPTGSHTINLKAQNPDGQTLESSKLVVMNVPDCSKPVEERTSAIAMLSPKADQAGEGAGIKLLQVPDAKGDVSAAKDLSLAAVNYDENGTVVLSGKGLPGKTVRVYVNNRPIGSAIVDENGNWILKPDRPIPEGTYTLRIDQVEADGKVISRVELPFQRAPADDVKLVRMNGGLNAIVQPGNSLWRIARRVYGAGLEYTVIYQANQDQIRDPDLIYPGQIFKLPANN